MVQRNQLQGLSALALASFVLVVLARWLQLDLLPSLTLWILVGACLESFLSFYGLTWGIRRSSRAFFSVFAVGSLARLASIGLVAYLMTVWGVPPAAPLLSLVAAYFVLSIVQLPFLTPHGLR